MIRKFFKWAAISLLAVIIVGGSFAAHEWYADKLFMYRAYLDRHMLKLAFEDPETLTSLGFLESMGIKGRNRPRHIRHPAEDEHEEVSAFPLV